MSASLNQIKDRIKLTKSIEKITSALKLTSSSKMKRMLKQFRQFRLFIDAVYESLDLLQMNMEQKDVEDKEIIFVITSEIGLCGAYNNHIWKMFEKYVEGRSNYEVIHIGRKLENRFKPYNPRKIDVHMSLGVNSPSNIKAINLEAKSIYDQIVDKKISKVSVVGHMFENQLLQKEKIFEILPIKLNTDAKKSVIEALEFSPTREVIFESIVPFYLSVALRAAIFESSLCIEAMRNIAMDAATQNAKDFIEKLSLEHNRARQALITQEIMEIVAGAEGE